MNLLKKRIVSREDIVNYIDFLVSTDMLYHFDDDAVDILTRVSDHELSLFTEEEAVLVDRRRDEMLKLDYDFAFEYALTKIE
jgi:hypothetical protein